MKHIQSQSGNALFLVMIAIGLLAALMMSLSESEKYTDTMDNEKMSLELQEIYQYSAAIEKAVSRLLLQNGCEVVELSFDHPDRINFDTADFYKNPNSPADMSCHVFDPAGGAVPFKPPPSIVQAQGVMEHGILGRAGIIGIGSEKQELIFHLHLSRAACLKVNIDHGIDNPDGEPPVSSHMQIVYPYTKNTTYPYFVSGHDEGFNGSISIGVNHRKTACVQTDEDGKYNYYHVLLAR